MNKTSRLDNVWQWTRQALLLQGIVLLVAGVLAWLIGWRTMQLYGGMVTFVGIGGSILLFILFGGLNLAPKYGGPFPHHQDLSLSQESGHGLPNANDPDKVYAITLMLIFSLIIGYLLQGM